MRFIPTSTRSLGHRPNRARPAAACAFAVLVAGIMSTAACHRGTAGPSTPAVTLEVTNRGYFDVNVFVVRSPVAPPTRLGMVTGGLSKTFRVPETDLQAGQVMVLQVRTIAGRTAWTSPSLSVSIGSVARLDVVTTSNGDLRQSQFYIQ